MWLSASAFFHQYYRVYSPVAFGKKTDKTGAYIRWVIYSISSPSVTQSLTKRDSLYSYDQRIGTPVTLQSPMSWSTGGLLVPLWLVDHPNSFCWLIRLIDKQFSGPSTMKLAFALNVWSKYSLPSKFGWLKTPVFISIYWTHICYWFHLLLKYRVGAVLKTCSIVSFVMIWKYCTSVFLSDFATMLYILCLHIV